MKDTQKIVPQSLKTSAECDAAMAVLQTAVDEIRTQLEAAAIDYNTRGISSDPDWMHRARVAIRAINRQKQAVQVRRGQLAAEERKTKHAANNTSFDDAFKRIVYERVGPDTMRKWLREARDRCEGETARKAGDDLLATLLTAAPPRTR